MQEQRLARLSELKETFGSHRVTEEQRRDFVRRLFDDIAPRYDLMNDLMSFGLHRLWKNVLSARAVSAMPSENSCLIDLAGGTGDIAAAVRKQMPQARIQIVDASQGMLNGALQRNAGKIETLCADAEALPLPSRSADVVTLAFGLRNMTNPGKAIAEVFRVLQPGGALMVLEFSKPAALFAPFYAVFSRFVIPALGALIADNRAAYTYLVESIRLFPDATSITTELLQAGFRVTQVRKFMFGVAALHVAEKPAAVVT